MSKCPEGKELTNLCGKNALLIRECCKTPNHRRYNIIPNIRKLGTGSYPNLEAIVKIMNDRELQDFGRFLRAVDNKLTQEKKKRRMGIPY
jgi:hypothetical protein